ncbi:hypothetical protein DFH06DRAFT_1354756 [Mycena polygramma]|nr:hypothetical protein DFH06DRAFT_1354756 [Mycena polygramma]
MSVRSCHSGVVFSSPLFLTGSEPPGASPASHPCFLLRCHYRNAFWMLPQVQLLAFENSFEFTTKHYVASEVLARPNFIFFAFDGRSMNPPAARQPHPSLSRHAIRWLLRASTSSGLVPAVSVPLKQETAGMVPRALRGPNVAPLFLKRWRVEPMLGMNFSPECGLHGQEPYFRSRTEKNKSEAPNVVILLYVFQDQASVLAEDNWVLLP